MEKNDDVDAQRRREECERKARRGEMDPRLEFAFQMLIDGTGLPRHQIMDHIFEGDMVSYIAMKSLYRFADFRFPKIHMPLLSILLSL